MNIYNYLERRKVLDIVKGNIYQLCIEPKIINLEKQKLYKHTFIVNKTQIELLTSKLITAKDGDFVIVAGVYNKGEFKAYSLKKIN
jgi:hypothetical protein